MGYILPRCRRYAGNDMERRLAAVVAVDVVGYSRLMGKDEAGTLAAVGCFGEVSSSPQLRHVPAG